MHPLFRDNSRTDVDRLALATSCIKSGAKPILVD